MKRNWTYSLILPATLAAVVSLTGCGGTTAEANNPNGDQNGDAATTEAKADSGGGFSLPWSSKKVEVTIPAGTALKIRTASTLSTKSAQSGEEFAANIADDVVIDGKTVIPAGSEARGLVVESDEGGRVKGTASLTLRLSEVQTSGGMVNIDTGSVTRAAKATKKKDAEKIGIGAGIGAAIGAIAGGGKGAAVGAAAGGGAGTGVVLATHGDPAVINAESVLSFELRNPVTVELN